MPVPFDPPLSNPEICLIFPQLLNIEIIKSGGEGTVLKAYDTKLAIMVAIKIYSSEHLQVRAELEVKKLAKIKNDHITTLLDYGEVQIRSSVCYYTTTSYINGKDLRTLINEGKHFSADEVKNVIICIASAIDALWAEKVVHCDIKPDNILEKNGVYTLIDLGIAKHLDASTVTAAGIVMGTMGYFSPEQLKGRRNLTFRSDYFALGITAYELLAGYHPFNRNQFEMASKRTPSFPLNLNIPEDMKNLIYKMTDLVPYMRPLNYKEINDLLQGV